MPTPYQDRPLLEPPLHAESAPFYEGCRQGKLLLKRNLTDRRAHWYPRVLCPFTQGPTEWFEASGLGTLYSFSVLRRALPAPFAIAYVTLDEGVQMLTNIVDCDLDELRIGDRLKVVFKQAGTQFVPMFTPL